MARKPQPPREPSGTETPSTPIGFEASIQRLAAIVEELEGGELPLEESLRLFEEGVLLARSSQQVLDAAEQRVELLLGLDRDGNPILERLDEDEGDT